LARWQANWTAQKLAEQLNIQGIATEIVVIQTSGDLIQNEAIVNIGAQGVFTKEIQRALLDNKIDVAVHSLKDLPTEYVSGLSLVAVPKRESYRDAFVSHIAEKIEDLPAGAKIGTGSLRRETQILHRFGNKYLVEDIRGNVETRLRKLEQGEYDALILAEAGLLRLGFADSIRSLLEPPFFLPAIGQGALGWEIRTDDRRMAELLQPLNDKSTLPSIVSKIYRQNTSLDFHLLLYRRGHPIGMLSCRTLPKRLMTCQRGQKSAPEVCGGRRKCCTILATNITSKTSGETLKHDCENWNKENVMR
jgi:hydroxymethylbilane synthase